MLAKRIREALSDNSGVSSLVTFILVVLPLIFIIMAIFEIANLSNTIISMNRGLQVCLVKTATSSLSMKDDARWQNNVSDYLLSQSNVRSQLDTVKFYGKGSSMPADDNVEPKTLSVKIIALSDAASAEASRAPDTTLVDYTAVNNLSYPTIGIEIKYRYYVVGPFLGYLVPMAANANSFVISSGMETINEHPNYAQ